VVSTRIDVHRILAVPASQAHMPLDADPAEGEVRDREVGATQGVYDPFMSRRPSDVAFSPAVKAQQERLGSRGIYEKMGSGAGWDEEITEKRAAFIRERDSIYIATASGDGRPYVQHRGGPKGFVKILDAKTLAFGEYAGNRQYISMGNLDENDRACLFLMDYPNRQRLKIWGRAKFVEDDPELMAKVVDADYAAKYERVFVFHVEVMDGNCPQHILPRFTLDEIDEIGDDVAALKARIRELEAQVAGCCPEEPTGAEG